MGGNAWPDSMAAAATPTKFDRPDPSSLETALRSAHPTGGQGEKLTMRLARLADAERFAGEARPADLSWLPADLRPLVTARLLRIDADDQVQIYAEAAGSLDDAMSVVVQGGGEVQRVDTENRIIQAYMPVRSLRAAALAPAISLIRLPDYAVREAGSVTSAGDSILRASQLRQNWDVNGSGVKVGVISDGLEGLADSQATGDLPAVNYTTCNSGAFADERRRGSRRDGHARDRA